MNFLKNMKSLDRSHPLFCPYVGKVQPCYCNAGRTDVSIECGNLAVKEKSGNLEIYCRVASSLIRSKKTKVACIIVARNEALNIGETLKALTSQTVKVSPILVVDDGSTDDTSLIAERYNCRVIRLPHHRESLVGRPELACRWNEGLENVKSSKPDYILLLGADHILPPDYIQRIVFEMEKDKRLVIASGAIHGGPYTPDFPWGSGRILATWFLSQLGFRYPVNYGWEDWLVYKARRLGLKTKCFKDILTFTKRPMNMENKGEIMYALGYDWRYALGRCLKASLRNPKAGLNMLKGFLLHKGIQRLDDVAGWVNQHQKLAFSKRLSLGR